MSVAVIADAHLSGPGGGPEPLIEQLEGLDVSSCERLVLLGDLFHVWIGFRRYQTPEMVAVAEALARVRSRGIPVDYIEGNRDFFLGSGLYDAAFDSVGRELSFSAGGKRFLAVHGDGLNDRDYQYRLWRFLSKNFLSRLAMRWLPGFVARRLVYRTEAWLAETNFKHKVVVPEETIRRYAERRLAEGYDVMILGHFHEPHTWEVDGGEVLLLDGWFNSRRLEWFPQPVDADRA